LRSVAYAVLAAGGSHRMGFPKAVTPLAGASPLARLARVLEGRRTIVVTAGALADACAQAIGWAQITINPHPEAGMTSTLLVAHRIADPAAVLAVLLADKPFVRRETLERCERALAENPGCDVLFPVNRGRPGHPVYFGPKARARLSSLAPGDTLRALRDDPQLQRVEIESSDDGTVIDLDTRAAWEAAERRLHA
jgi:molybdenum cofactor cytidylyltransferase